MKLKLLAIGLLALLAFGLSERAEARGRCLMKYRGVYFHAPMHKAFATSNGDPVTSPVACGASWGGSLIKVKADALKRCKGFEEGVMKGKACKIIDAH
ncbi:MAG: hypothetical protein M3O03_10800 [Pseudomonadota bacterium]|nr:hypothetical protein [Pseudomonadota bacterium]